MIPASVRVFVCTEPQAMRRGFDMLAQVVINLLRNGRGYRALAAQHFFSQLSGLLGI